MSRAALAWRVYGIIALALALFGVGHWIWAVTLAGPVMYGEGAVAHAALLARYGFEYTLGGSLGDLGDPRPIFTAANYPPLYFDLASLGDPFVTGRIVSIVATLFVGAAIAWRARPAGALVALTLALAWLGSVPILQWGAAVKPDLVALALTVAAVTVLDRRRPMYMTGGALLALAMLAKPTALLPALALFTLLLRRDRRGAARGLASAVAVGGAALLVMVGPPSANFRTHVLDLNGLAYRLDLLAPLVLFALIVLAVPIATVLVTRPSTTVVTAYVAGAIGILLLGGREGATINYFLDLSAAIALAVAGRAPRLATSVAYPVAAIVGAAVAVFLVNPFAIVPGRGAGPGAWGDPARVGAVARIPGTLLVEDAGLLVANGREPAVDDVFLWSRNRAREVTGTFPFPEGARLLDAVSSGAFDAVVTEVDLTQLDAVGGYERQRWHPDLVKAVLDRYPSMSRDAAGLFVYRKP